MVNKRAIIIGGGIGGLATACLLAKNGWEVELFEKNNQLGGRAGLIEAQGFRFDSGPSWYLMPDVFEKFFTSVGENIGDYLELVRLKPSYQVFFKDVLDKPVTIFGDLKRDRKTFDAIEPGAGEQLEKYLSRSQYVYKTAIETFLYRNYDSVRDFMSLDLIKEGRKLSVFSNMDRYVRKYFTSPELKKIMEYPLVFLGSSPYNAPALYSLLSHVDFNQGVFYPKGGMYRITQALVTIAQKHGAKLHQNTSVKHIISKTGIASGVELENGTLVDTDVVISNADMHFTEQHLLPLGLRDHSEKYWQKRTLAPSALLIYLGVKGSLPKLTHHNLIFSKDWQQNFQEIFAKRAQKFPTDPSLYICNPSKTDPTVAPPGHENMFVLVPIAAGTTYSQKELEAFADKILRTVEQETGEADIRKNIVYKKLFCVDDFARQFNSYRGTGLGLAHTLSQTAAFRPNNVSKKVKNLYYVGANVHPGIGLPPVLISAELAYRRIQSQSWN